MVLALDGDNTLWDTNGVYLTAQQDLLDKLEVTGHPVVGDRLEILRKTDMAIARQIGLFEYDSVFLVRALIRVSNGEPIDRAARFAVAHTPDELERVERESMDEMASKFRATISDQIPKLLPGALELLSWLEMNYQQSRVIGYLVSEGNFNRVNSTLVHYVGPAALDFLIPYVVPVKSNIDFEQVVSDGRKKLGDANAVYAAIGDSLRRDIVPANEAGAITIYKPSGFHGSESTETGTPPPDHVIETLDAAVQILDSIILQR